MKRQARAAPTPFEERAWEIVRDRRVDGWKFRRQHPIGVFRADFYCAALALVIEIDGDVHDTPEQRRYDEARTDALRAMGLRVVRVPNEQVTRKALTALIRSVADDRERGRQTR